MIISRAGLLAAFASLLACGGGDDDPVSPQEAATEVANAVCDWIEECGQWQIDCDEEECTATLVDVSRAECVADRRLDELAELECGDLTSEQRDLVGDCVDGLAARACVSQDQIDEYLAALERDEAPDEPGAPIPEPCAELEDVIAACSNGQPASNL